MDLKAKVDRAAEPQATLLTEIQELRDAGGPQRSEQLGRFAELLQKELGASKVIRETLELAEKAVKQAEDFLAEKKHQAAGELEPKFKDLSNEIVKQGRRIPDDLTQRAARVFSIARFRVSAEPLRKEALKAASASDGAAKDRDLERVTADIQQLLAAVTTPPDPANAEEVRLHRRLTKALEALKHPAPASNAHTLIVVFATSSFPQAQKLILPELQRVLDERQQKVVGQQAFVISKQEGWIGWAGKDKDNDELKKLENDSLFGSKVPVTEALAQTTDLIEDMTLKHRRRIMQTICLWCSIDVPPQYYPPPQAKFTPDYALNIFWLGLSPLREEDDSRLTQWFTGTPWEYFEKRTFKDGLSANLMLRIDSPK